MPPGRPGLHPPGGLTGGPSLPALSGSRPAPSRGDAGSDDAGGDDNKDLLEKILKTLVEMKDAIEERPAAKPVGGPPAAKPAARAARSASADRTARGGGAADAASRAEGMIAFARKLGTAVEAAGS